MERLSSNPLKTKKEESNQVIPEVTQGGNRKSKVADQGATPKDFQKQHIDNSLKPYSSPILFHQCLRKNKLDKQFSKFLDVFKKLHLNIPFADALEQISSL